MFVAFLIIIHFLLYILLLITLAHFGVLPKFNFFLFFLKHFQNPFVINLLEVFYIKKKEINNILFSTNK